MTETPPCLAAWPDIARALSRDEATRPRPLRQDGSVVRFDDVVLKHIPENFGRAVRAHRQAFRALKDQPHHHAPRLLGCDEARCVLAVSFAPGLPLRDLLEEGGDATQLCARAGAWLGAFHASRDRDSVSFDAMGPLNRVPQTATLLPDHYKDMRATLERQAHALNGTAIPRAVLHGDLHSGNLLMTPQGDTTGIDFENLHLHPAMRDAGQLLADMHFHTMAPPGSLLPETWQSAFAASYGACGPELAFFVTQRILQVWAHLPARSADRGAKREAQARTIHAICKGMSH